MAKKKPGSVNPDAEIATKTLNLRCFQDLRQATLQQQISEVLIPEADSSKKITNLRTAYGLSQRNMQKGIDEILNGISIGGIPSISKVENGRRRISFLEGLAIAIVLNVSPWDIAPDYLAERKTIANQMSQWILVKVQGECLIFRHITKDTILSIVPATEVRIPDTWKRGKGNVPYAELKKLNPKLRVDAIEKVA